MNISVDKVVEDIQNDLVDNLSQYVKSDQFDSSKTFFLPSINKLPQLFQNPLTLIQIACFFGAEKCFNLLKEEKYPTESPKNTPNLASCAAAGGNINIVNAVSYIEENFDDALFSAIAFGHNELYMGIVYGRYSDEPLNMRDKDGRTFLHIAAIAGNEQALLYFISKGVDLNAIDNNGLTALHYTCMKSDLNCFCALIFRPECNINIFNKKYGTPLNICILNNFRQAGHLLLQRSDIDVNIANENGETPLHIAIRQNNIEFLELMMKRVDIRTDIKTKSGDSGIILAAKVSSKDILKRVMLMNSTNINDTDSNLNTPLHLVMIGKKHAMFNVLIQNQYIDLNKANADGYTPLLIAAHQNDTELVNFLLATNKVDVNARTDQYETALHFAVMEKNKEIIELLLSYPNINPNIVNKKGETPLHIACNLNFIEGIKLIVNNDNVDGNIEDNEGRTAILLSCISTEAFRLVYRSGKCDINHIDRKSNNIFHYAANKTTILKELMDSCVLVDPNQKNHDGKSALDLSKGEPHQYLEAISNSYQHLRGPPTFN